MSSYCDYLSTVCGIAKQAGEKILAIYETDFTIEKKADQSPLTTADLASHHTIVKALRQLTPDIPILSEESANIDFTTRQTWQRYWLIDPLDGTKEFIKKNGEFTVNIALIEQGKSVLGVVYVPVSGLLYFACQSQGAWKQQTQQPPQKITVRTNTRQPLLVAGSRSHKGEVLQGFLANLGDYDLLSMGSSLKLCLVADGQADIYPRLALTSEWDTAAAQCIVEQAGGKVTTLDMQVLQYNQKESLLNPFFFVFGDLSIDWSSYLPENVA